MFKIPFLDLPPMNGAGGSVTLPGSKSISNRVLLLAGLAEGTTVVQDLLQSDDTAVMLQALRQLGCSIEVDGRTCRVRGVGGTLAVREASLFLGNAGTAMRPLTAALALLATSQGGRFELSGVARMHERPIGDLVDALRPLGCRIECLGKEGYPPLRLSGDGDPLALRLDEPIRVRGDVSSQFLTALLLALPLVTADRSAVIEVQGELISKPYVEITLKLLQRFGVEVIRQEFQRFTVPQGSRYRTPGTVHIEGDASSASYFIALGAIAAHGVNTVRIEGVGEASIQGDIRFVEAARAMGAEVHSEANALLVRRGRWPLQGVTMDCNHIPDAAMTLAVMALYADTPTRLTNIASWRVKETDRIAAMAAELRKVGATVIEGADFIEVSPPRTWQAASIHTYDDHRMAMCLSLAAFNPLAAVADAAVDPAHASSALHAGVPIRIQDPACVAKTFPDYFEALMSLAQCRSEQVPVLTVDGPSASGKGTLASRLAQRLGYHQLDSGAIYRAAGVAAEHAGVDLKDEAAVAAFATGMELRFDGDAVLIGGVDMTSAVRSEHGGMLASRISAMPQVRRALHALQTSFRRLPGLVADGRDMGTVLFPDAQLKVFLTASAAQRALRRHHQLALAGVDAKIEILRTDLEVRDARDSSRITAPLKPAEDSMALDNSDMGIDASVDLVLGWWSRRRPF